MRTKLSNTFYEYSKKIEKTETADEKEMMERAEAIDKMKSMLQAFDVKPIPQEEFEQLANEFKVIKNRNGTSFTDHLLVDKSLMDVINDSVKKYANFCITERDNEMCIMLHLSDNVSSLDYDDEVYGLTEVQINALKIYNLDKRPIPNDLLKEKDNYKNGLGVYINKVTNRVNTQVVSYEREDLVLYHNTTKSIYLGSWANFKYIKISFIVFKDIPGSILNFEYMKRLGRISIALQYYFEVQNSLTKTTTISLSSPSDITSLWP